MPVFSYLTRFFEKMGCALENALYITVSKSTPFDNKKKTFEVLTRVTKIIPKIINFDHW